MLQQIAPTGALDKIATPSSIGYSNNVEVFQTAAAGADAALEKMSRNALNELSDAELYHLEAIVLPLNRPAVFVKGTTYDDLPASWGYLNTLEMKTRLGRAFPSIGRVNVPNSPLLPYAGTAFVVGDGLLMTNRHVAEVFSRGLGLKILYTPGDAEIGFTHEAEETKAVVQITVTKVEMIHPYWDMALLQVDGLSQTPLTLCAESPDNLIGHDIVVVGYPAMDPRNNIPLQNQIFGQTFNVKRMQPGTLRPPAQIGSFQSTVNALTHDASTLGGNSGSAVLDVRTGNVVALHFAGEYLKANYAVPMYGLAGDSRLSSTLSFSPSVPATKDYDAVWQRASVGELIVVTSPTASHPPRGISAAPAAPLQSPASTVASPQQNFPSMSLTTQIDISAGQLVSVTTRIAPLGTVAVSETGGPPEEGVIVDQDYSDRQGYDPDFLDGLHVPLPGLSATMKKATVEVPIQHRKHGDPYELAYHHYSVSMNLARRTAWFSAANIDGKQRPPIGKREGDRWYVDTRIPKTAQLTQKAFEHGIDRGHLTRREDTAWGTSVASAIEANNDTFHFTNCSLQASMFNRGKDRWQGLEQFLLEQHAKKDKRRMIVITGPRFTANDPVYRNDRMDYSVRCPLQFWKVCVLVREDGSAAATGFILGQNEIADLPGFTEGFEVGVAQIKIADLAKETGLSFGDLAKYDHFAQSGPGSLETLETPVTLAQVKAIRDAGDIVI
jgi:DNA/RNA endonuclease G (NUC1)/S1-C subfamily serine protease